MSVLYPYRTSLNECDLCGAEMASAQGHVLGSLNLCPGCGSGDYERALKFWRFELTEGFSNKQRRDTWHGAYTFGLKRPTSIPIIVTLRKETTNKKIAKFFGKKELEIGIREFDRRIIIEPDEGYESIVREVLNIKACRDIIIHFLAQGKGDKRDDTVELTNQLVSGYITVPDKTKDLEIKALRTHAIALAVHIERFSQKAIRRD